MKVLLVIVMIFGIALSQNQGYYMIYDYPNLNNNRPRNMQRSQVPTVEVQKVTAEWMCNNLVTGDVKFFGIKDVKTSHFSQSDVERLLQNGGNNNNQNQNNYQNNPFLNTQTPKLQKTTEPPNVDGVGLIDARFGN